MAIFPPEQRIWWKQPLHKQELWWLGICIAWALTMFFTMIVWHSIGDQNLSNEAYQISPDKFEQRTVEMVEKYQVREEGDTGVPVVRPPAETDIYMLARTYEWWPVLELEKGKSYRLHLSSMDLQHGFSLQPTNINVQVHPGYELVMTVTPNATGEFGVICNEFCGIGHHTMVGRIHVVE